MRDTLDRVPRIAIPEEVGLLGRLEHPSWALAVTALLLSLVGLVTVNSASTELPVDYFPRQLAWVGLGVVAMVVGLLVNYRTLLRVAIPAYAVGLLMMTGILFFGHEAGGARSWVGFAGFGMQPSELMKLATALVLVRFLAGREERFVGLRGVATVGLIAVLPFCFILLEPDLGGALILLPMSAALVWVAGIRARTLTVVGILLLLGLTGFWFFGSRDYQRDRVLTLFSPSADPLGAGYHVQQSKIAVGSGELLGKGYMQGTQSQLRFLPARHTDFIFAVLAEERGFLGVVAVMALYLLFFYNGVRVASRARDRHGILLVVGLLALMTFHVLYNASMMVGLVPITGIPLPFISYGGSFTLFCFFSTGLILSVDFRRFVNR